LRQYKWFILFFCFFVFPLNVFADSASSSMVMEMSSGRILYSRDANRKKLIASITKIMTCIVVLENANLDKEVTVGEEVLKMYGTNIYIEVGEKLKIKEISMINTQDDFKEKLKQKICQIRNILFYKKRR